MVLGEVTKTQVDAAFQHSPTVGIGELGLLPTGRRPYFPPETIQTYDVNGDMHLDRYPHPVLSSFTPLQERYIGEVIGRLSGVAVNTEKRPAGDFATCIVSAFLNQPSNERSFGEALVVAMSGLIDDFAASDPELNAAMGAMFYVAGADGMSEVIMQSVLFLHLAREGELTRGTIDKFAPIDQEDFHQMHKSDFVGGVGYEGSCAAPGLGRLLKHFAALAAISIVEQRIDLSTYNSKTVDENIALGKQYENISRRLRTIALDASGWSPQ